MLKNNNVDSMLDVIWEALHGYRQNCIPEGTNEYDDEWSDICTAMAWIEEDLKFLEEAEAFTIEENV